MTLPKSVLQVTRVYYKECAELVKAATGAWKVEAFDHNIRSGTSTTRAAKLKDVTIPSGYNVQVAHFLFADFLTG